MEGGKPRFQGRAGVVTGAGSGLGREVMAALVAEGASVVALDRDQRAGEDAVASALPGPGAAVFAPGDVTQEEDIVAAIERCKREFGNFDLIHNNAGVQGAARFHETDNETWDLVQDINLKAVFWGCKHAIRAMRAGKGGAIVNTASMLSIVGDPLLPAYTAAKTGVVGLTKAVAVDYASESIRCNCVCPGDMDTKMNQEYFDSFEDPSGERAIVEAHYPLRRIAHPAEVARAVLFLLSDEASFITGTYLLVDGGLTAKPY